jgi:hypothetical protein
VFWLIWWGKKQTRRMVRTGTFDCPSCRSTEPCTFFEVLSRATLYSVIPLGRGRVVGHLARCETCGGQFPTTDDGQAVAAAARPGQTWECRLCGNTNPASSATCLRCGAAASG